MTGVVERYLAALVAHDWGATEACLAPDVVRIGPFGDTYTPRAAYLDFLRDLMPKLPGYSMEVHRVVGDGPVVVAELSETVEFDGVTGRDPGSRSSSTSTTTVASSGWRCTSSGWERSLTRLDEVSRRGPPGSLLCCPLRPMVGGEGPSKTR